ncbi:phosphatidylserine decarboxylase 1 [Sorochytrium milnesiophthora]
MATLLLARSRLLGTARHSARLWSPSVTVAAARRSLKTSEQGRLNDTKQHVEQQQQQQQQHQQKESPWWIPTIPVGVGLSLIAFIQYRRLARKRQQLPAHQTDDAGPVHVSMDAPWQLHLLLTLPLRSLSRLWGYMHNDIVIPVWLRSPLYRLYAGLFGCNLDEMKQPDLKAYPNLGTFFYREIDLDRYRPVDPTAEVISPCDGTIIHWGVIASTGDIVHNVKGASYKVAQLLGKREMDIREHSHSQQVLTSEQIMRINTIEYGVEELLGVEAGAETEVEHATVTGAATTTGAAPSASQSGSAMAAKVPDTIKKGLFFAVIYLAPGDYHRFHSPVDWEVKERRHIHGELLSVSPKLLDVVPDLFTLNERVALMGTWKHGMFSMIPVGATNVGSVKINFDDTLLTNVAKPEKHVTLRLYDPPVKSQKLDEMGGFMLGSTIVLVFEAPLEQFVWTIDQLKEKRMVEGLVGPRGVRIKVGESLGELPRE